MKQEEMEATSQIVYFAKKLFWYFSLGILIIKPLQGYSQLKRVNQQMGAQRIENYKPAKRAQRKLIRFNRKKLRPFDINYFSNPENKHYLLNIQTDSPNVQVQGAILGLGNLPHKPRGGNLLVSYLDADEEVIGEYYRSDFLQGRSCDSIQIGIYDYPLGFSVPVQLPFDPRIAFVEFSWLDRNRSPERIDIRQQLAPLN